MKNLFYLQKDNLLFWVAGYTRDGNTSSVVEQCQSLTENATKLATLVNADIKHIYTFFVEKSRRYKYMRVFWIKTDVIPEEAYVITNSDWTMMKWVQD